jgi:protein phosphatase
MKIAIPEFCLVALVGTTGSGKSTFARRHFKSTEVIGSDWARGLVEDDEGSQDATGDAFDVVHYIAEKRLKRRRIAVIDATNVRAEDRAGLVKLARAYHALAVAIVLNPGEDVCHERNLTRPDRQFGAHVIRNQTRSLKRNINRMEKEGFRYVFELRSAKDIDAVEIVRERLWTDRREETGPFDIIGDVHGCADELVELMGQLGYQVELVEHDGVRRAQVATPPGRRAIFVGDLVDRGPRSPDVLRIVMSMVSAGQAFCVPGNHDAKFGRWLNGRNVKPTHGLDGTIAQMEAEPLSFRAEVKEFVDGLVSHAWLDNGRLVVAHAGIKEDMIGRSSGAVREFCLYGETTGETDEFGLPIRYHWAAEYRGPTAVVYGHTPIPEAEWLNNTLCIDTGCCFGGKLTALRWPEKEMISVPARAQYAEPRRPFGHPPLRPGADEAIALETPSDKEPRAADHGLSAQARHDDVLDLADVLGKRVVTVAGGRSITIQEANAAAALEVMTRFAVSPKWLVYLPPTMSPSETTAREGLLEHPDEAFAYFQREGVSEVVVEEKHMGSRACLVVCRGEDTARRRFGVTTGETGCVFTRTGRAFFPDRATSEAVLARLRQAMDACDFWAAQATDWALIDAEIMPWSAKAQGLISAQYAPTAAAARAGLSAVGELVAQAAREGPAASDLASVAARFEGRARRAELYAEAYRRYCWPVATLDDYRIAPFHLLATEGAVHMDKTHAWHMAELERITRADDPLLMATPYRIVDLDEDSEKDGAASWWEERTAAGGEGMVVKPMSFLARGPRGPVQPAIKCRGPEYLRIIYGPEYDLPGNLARLRKRGLGLKRSLAMRETALGQEALTRFIAREPLRRVHECVFAILALESEPVDPRL